MHAGTVGARAFPACMQDYEPPSGAIAEHIEKDFGSLDALIAKFNPMAVGVQARMHAACAALHSPACHYSASLGEWQPSLGTRHMT